MNERHILAALELGEEKDWEFKSAKGGLPGSMWETYGAMANTDGGVIALGVEEKNREFTVGGIENSAKMKSDFWSLVNNKGKVSANLLTDEQVAIKQIAGKSILLVSVPRATRKQRPVYVGQNPLLGTYRRNFDGDYRCTEDEVGRMLADRAEEPADCRILENFGLSDIDQRSLKQYRQRFSARDPDHPWLKETLRGFLDRLGAWRKDRATGREGLTVAGLLMFGKDRALRDPDAIPEFHIDYRERLSDDPDIRWTDRLTTDGTWVANLFQFYQRVIQRLTADLKIPFRLEPNLFRRDETIVHEAVREALVNALIHADYRGQGGIVIEKYRDRLELSNPGTLLVSLEQLMRGGVSECRNKSLQTMFLMIGGGERAGSGLDKIRQAWKSQHWRFPRIREMMQPDRVQLVLRMVSLLPEDSQVRLRERFGRKIEKLGPLDVQALVTAELEGGVSNSRLQEICDEHPADLTKLLLRLAANGFLEQVGQKRGCSYQLPSLSQLTGSSTHKVVDSPHNPGDSPHKPGNSPHKPAEQDPILMQIAAPAKAKRRLSPAETRSLISGLCKNRFLAAREIASLLERDLKALRDRFLSPMVQEGHLVLRYPDEPNRPDQAYSVGKKKR